MNVLNEKMYSTNEVVSKLELLDIYCTQNNTSGELLMIGGSALLVSMELLAIEFRPTRDIDLKILNSSDEKALIKSIQDANLDLIVGTIEVPPVEDFLDMPRYELEISTLQSIKVYVPSMEMLACTKLFSKRTKDLEDLEQSKMLDLCDKVFLFSLIDEYKDYILNPQHPDWNYHKINDIFVVKGL